MGEEREYLSGYKILAGKKYKVNRIEHNGMVFYKIKVTQKDANGKQKYYDRIVNFRKNVNLPDKTMIIPIKFIENMRDNPKDKYNPIITLMILEFEDLGTIINCIVIETMQIYLSGGLDKLEESIKGGVDNG